MVREESQEYREGSSGRRATGVDEAAEGVQKGTSGRALKGEARRLIEENGWYAEGRKGHGGSARTPGRTGRKRGNKARGTVP